MKFEIDTLLREVSFNIGTLREAKRRFAAQLAPEFSIFDYFRADEVALSKCLAGLLNPQGAHGQGSVFLSAFFEMMCPPETIFDLETCDVRTEQQANGQRRIDVYLEFSDGIVGIENKPWAGDQALQLSDYADHLKDTANGRNWLLLYLCNSDPSESSLPMEKRKHLEASGNYFQVDYFKLNQWLYFCKSKSEALSVRVFIDELLKFVRVKVNGELEMSEENEVRSVALSSKNNLGAAFAVSKALSGVKADLMMKFHDALKSELDMHGFHLIWDDKMNGDWIKWTGFGVKFNKNQDLYLRFEFEGIELDKFFWGICRVDETVQPFGRRWDFVAELMSNEFITKNQSTKVWPWYSVGSRELIGKDVKCWSDPKFLWDEIIENNAVNLSKHISEMAIRVKKIFSENMDLLTSGRAEV